MKVAGRPLCIDDGHNSDDADRMPSETTRVAATVFDARRLSFAAFDAMMDPVSFFFLYPFPACAA